MGFDNPLHLAFVVLVVLLVFGAKRLPEMGRSLGAGMRGFRESISAETTALPDATAAPPATALPPATAVQHATAVRHPTPAPHPPTATHAGGERPARHPLSER
jgi:sec-independent protein translocase protein TatA